MFSIRIEVVPVRDGESVSGTFLEQKLQNGSWVNVREHTFVSKDGSSKRNIALEDNHRLVIAAQSDVKTTMDKAQNAHVTVRPPVVHPRAGIIKHYKPPVDSNEDQGTNDTGISLSEQAALEFEERQRAAAMEKIRAEAEAKAQEHAKSVAAEEAARSAVQISSPLVEKPPAVMVSTPASQGEKDGNTISGNGPG